FDVSGPPWVRSDGVFVVADAGDIVARGFLAPIVLSTSGAYVFGQAWSSASPNNGAVGTCNDWRSADAGAALTDPIGGLVPPFAEPCSFSGVRLLCLQE